ncbi:hypothetical protein BP5796_06370 [Coleophoma crateriformis]|uniref:Uncharacterized protein n=1 Tax=Coleophoma crateriformis TaxID=565419 RepID=A0A3D8RWZ0_9HELO|nr:hypothetical protein BP5796_06370 [Coleophoma crateriformis]
MDLLPSLAPRDSHSLWYTSTHTSNGYLNHNELNQNAFDHLPVNAGQASSQHAGHRRPHHNALHRSALARLRLDEEYMERRKQNVQNYGNSWIKPPGISKSLYQQREEKREMEEHQEALRREQLAQELADAEAADELLQGDGGDGEMDEARDLDDDVPDAETTGLEADEDGDSESGEEDHDVDEVPRGVLASRMPDDVYREALIRGDELRQTAFGDEAGSTIDEVDQSQMLQEEDLVHDPSLGHGVDMGEDINMDMDADLDADIPEAESLGGYEHTDTDEELSSSEEESGLPDYSSHEIPAASSMVRSDGTQSSTGHLDSMLSRATEGSSSQLGSSPGPLSGPRRRRSGH